MLMKNISVSVVIPTCGRMDLLGRCLDALCKQTLDTAFYEIIVVDDRPDFATHHMVAERARQAAEKGLDIIYIANNGTHGPAAARNCGWRVARGDVIAFTDDDTVPTPGWLENGLSVFDGTVHALCGRIEMPLPANLTDYQLDAQQLETAEFVTANCFCRKDVLEYLKGFDERFQFAWREDSDLHFRLLELHANIVRLPQAVVVHPVRPASWGVCLSQQKKILFDALLYKKHPQLYREKIRATPRWDYYLIVISLLTAIVGLAVGNLTIAFCAGAVWLSMTAGFCLMRLRGTAKSFSHISEMVITSALIPPHAVFWRMVGAWRFRVFFV